MKIGLITFLDVEVEIKSNFFRRFCCNINLQLKDFKSMKDFSELFAIMAFMQPLELRGLIDFVYLGSLLIMYVDYEALFHFLCGQNC